MTWIDMLSLGLLSQKICAVSARVVRDTFGQTRNILNPILRHNV